MANSTKWVLLLLVCGSWPAGGSAMGGTLLAGMYEMHAHHLQQEDALLNLVAGITTVRDMGSDNAVLDGLIEQLNSGLNSESSPSYRPRR